MRGAGIILSNSKLNYCLNCNFEENSASDGSSIFM
jgi:hypothetical protein